MIACQYPRSHATAIAVERSDLDIAACNHCRHIFNRAFEPERIAYTQHYENSIGFSARHRAHIQAIARSLVNRHNLCGKTVVEIGCGDGDFLREVCKVGSNRGIGLDPSRARESRKPVGMGTVEIINALFEDVRLRSVDAIAAQHVLEHLPQPVETLRRARQNLRSGGLGYFEVPNARSIFHGLNVWDLIYEHVSYFSPGSLDRALTEAGFSTLRIEATFGDQYLDAEACTRPRDNFHRGGSFPRDDAELDGFPERFAYIVGYWQRCLSDWRKHRQKTVLWGAGAKAVSMLSALGISAGAGIDYIVDISPRKVGRYLPGTGQLIVPPDFLRDYRPNLIVIMNPEYRSEIETQVHDLRISPAIVDSVPPVF